MHFFILFFAAVRSTKVRCFPVEEEPDLPYLPDLVIEEIISRVDATKSLESWKELNSWRRVSRLWNKFILARVDRILDAKKQWLEKFGDGNGNDDAPPSEWKLMLASPYLAVRLLRVLPQYRREMLAGSNPLPTVPRGEMRRLFDVEVRKLYLEKTPGTEILAYMFVAAFGLSPAFFKALDVKLNEVFLTRFPDIASELLIGKEDITWEHIREYLRYTIFFVDDGPAFTQHDPNLAMGESYMTVGRLQRKELLEEVVKSTKLPAEDKRLRVSFERPIKWDHRKDVYNSLDWDNIIGDMEARDGGKLVLQLHSKASARGGYLKPISLKYFRWKYFWKGLPAEWFEEPRIEE